MAQIKPDEQTTLQGRCQDLVVEWGSDFDPKAIHDFVMTEFLGVLRMLKLKHPTGKTSDRDIMIAMRERGVV